MARPGFQNDDVLSHCDVFGEEFAEGATDRFVGAARRLSADNRINAATLGQTQFLNVSGQRRLRNVDFAREQILPAVPPGW